MQNVVMVVINVFHVFVNKCCVNVCYVHTMRKQRRNKGSREEEKETRETSSDGGATRASNSLFIISNIIYLDL